MRDRFHILVARKIAGSITPVEVKELESMLSKHPDLHLPMELMERMIDQEQQQQASPEASEAFVRHWLKFNDELNLPIQHAGAPLKNNTSRRLRIPRSRFFQFLFAAAFLFIPCLFIYKSFTGESKTASPVSQIVTITTTAGANRKVELPDGSKVWLNASSVLRYDANAFKQGKRRVNFEGEGFFDIAHDASRPFLLSSGNLQIRVLGTAFNVKAYPEESNIETSLIRGSVEVRLQTRPDDVYILRPQEKLVVSRLDEAMPIEKINAEKTGKQTLSRIPLVSLSKITITDSGRLVEETAWMQNKLVFRSEPFSSLANKLERRYGIHFYFENMYAKELEFTGTFTTETIEQALEAMQLVHHFSFKIDQENIYIR